MTLGDHCYLLEASLTQAAATKVNLNGQIGIQIINEAMQAVYQIAVKTDPTLYQFSATFSNGTSFSLPAHYRSTVLVRVATRQADDLPTFSGAARFADTRKFRTLLTSSINGATEDHPLYTVKASTIEIRPSCEGVHYFIQTIPYVTDLTYDISAIGVENKPMLIPWRLEDLVILHARILGATREATRGDIPKSLQSKYMAAADESRKMLEKAMEPMQVFKRNTVTPVTQ